MEIDCELTLDQWEALKGLRSFRPASRPLNRLVTDRLLGLGLISNAGAIPVLTARGRYVLIRGSARLLDVAA